MSMAAIDERQLRETHIRSTLPPPKTQNVVPDVHGMVHKDIGPVET